MITDDQTKEMQTTVAREFPGDIALQELHKIRWLNYVKTQNMSRDELVTYYNDVELPARSRA